MTANRSFPVGDTVRLTFKFRVNDVLTNPTTVTVTLEDPAGANTAPTASSSATGIYTCSFVVSVAGYYRFKVTSTGSAAGVREGTFYVHTSGIV